MNIKEFYNNKLSQFGPDDFRSLYWGDKNGTSAKSRYSQISQIIALHNNNIVEIGCGWGSFFDFGFKCQSYLGMDINENFISLAKKKYPNSKWTTEFPKGYYDICISSGVAGNRGGPAWNPSLLKKYLINMFNIADNVFVNFPSNRSDTRSENVEYFSPEYVLSEILNITHNVQLIHKNQFDFLLYYSH